MGNFAWELIRDEGRLWSLDFKLEKRACVTRIEVHDVGWLVKLIILGQSAA